MSKHLALTTDRTTLAGWLTPERRKAFYGLASALLAVSLATNLFTPQDVAHVADAVTAVIGVLTGVVAFLHTGGVYKAPAAPVDEAQ